MKKKTAANLIMVAIILVIAAAGVLGVGHIQGWFDADDGTQAVLSDIVGIIHLERGGVSYPVTEDTVLRKGDKLTCEKGATAVIRMGEDTVIIGESAALSVKDPDADAFCMDVSFGQLFVNCSGNATFTFEGHTAAVENSVILLSVRSGAQTVTVLAGSVDGVSAGNSMEYIGQEISASVLQIGSLNDFALTNIRKTNETVSLCVTNEELDKLEADRLAALQDAINNAGSIQPTESPESDHIHSYVDHVAAPTCSEKGYTSHTCSCGDSYQDTYTDPTGHTWGDWVTTVQPTTAKEGTRQRECINCDAFETGTFAKLEAGHTHSYTEKTVAATCTTGGYTLYTCSCGDSYKDSVTSAAGHSWGDWAVTKEATTSETGMKERVCKNCGEKQQETTEKLTDPAIAGYVYITIRCDTILDNMDNLNPAKAEFVPDDGEILPMVSVYFYEGETVFEVLKRVCEISGIQLEYSWTPLYSSYYIEGINNLYEFDCGNESGWMYKVNEWFPNYGCSSYELVDGDVIVWCYTCNGLGADVGDDWMANE